MLEKSLAAIAIPRDDMPASFDFGAFLVQLEKEAPKQGYDAFDLANELYPLRLDAFQRKFLITFLGTMLHIMQKADDAAGARRPNA